MLLVVVPIQNLAAPTGLIDGQPSRVNGVEAMARSGKPILMDLQSVVEVGEVRLRRSENRNHGDRKDG